jgi:putative membrane protein
MLAIKMLHIVAVICWFAGLFYLPRLFVYHCLHREMSMVFMVMEKKLYWIIMTPAAILTLCSGLGLWYMQGVSDGWIHAKLALVLFLVAYQLCCFGWLRQLATGRCRHGARFFRMMNELPTMFLLLIVYLVVFKPF